MFLSGLNSGFYRHVCSFDHELKNCDLDKWFFIFFYLDTGRTYCNHKILLFMNQYLPWYVCKYVRTWRSMYYQLIVLSKLSFNIKIALYVNVHLHFLIQNFLLNQTCFCTFVYNPFGGGKNTCHYLKTYYYIKVMRLVRQIFTFWHKK